MCQHGPVSQGFHDAATQQWQAVANTTFLATSRSQLSTSNGAALPPRLARHFATLTVTPMSQSSMCAALDGMLSSQGLSEAVAAGAPALVKASMAALDQLDRVLPSGHGCVRSFELRDVLRQWQVRHHSSMPPCIIESQHHM